MEITFLGTGAALPTKERNTQAIALNLEPYSNSIWLFDAGEGTQHQILHHSIKLGKINHIFITHMHGDHIYGLPGILTSRSFQGGENKPLTIVGPRGIKEYIEITLQASLSRLNYPITFIEIDEQLHYQHEGITVTAYHLNHGVPSFGYRIEAPTTPGKINVAALREIGMEPGPKYQEVKDSETFIFNDKIYQSSEFKGEAKVGPKIAIFGDTMPCENELKIAHGVDVLVHESTYIDGDRTLADNHHHSHIADVLSLLEESEAKQALLNHISNRYNLNDIDKLYAELQNQYPDLKFKFVRDFDTFTI
ncbi:putative ribonuclease Z [Staphylococcus piscifermentans]|uniref:Ribonuclease Z n=1 Tax=Staphylococcus piscifermentans TaxID=70258 RepID=A0A239U255_9STAP|nr:ribonuclease Z [Staphylococcus piscifermentans]RTX84616.1 ribonuclease Z [Staphylococcus piscifermentans]GEP84769.1 ribonuclease Z [Staphylococcus piscifermentans]SNV04080.1 putative ribonuclease Z [Staphylococcus piscifermentans]